MELPAIRSRLADSGGRLYWRSLGEVADTPEFREYLHREFPEQASEWNDPKGRRQFLKLMGASLALAGVGACTKQPPEFIVPYVRQPEDLVPGRPLFFATAIPFSGIAAPVLVESHMGRPTKIEGNPEHPASLGATDAITQAMVLGLYDPDRLQATTFRGEIRSWTDFRVSIATVIAGQKATGGAGLRILTGPITSPSLAELMASVLETYPKAHWHQYDPVSAGGPRATAAPAVGMPGQPVYHFQKADVILSLDADFLACGPGSVRYSRDFADRRRVSDEQKTMNRLYAVESTPSLTGAKADHRLPMRASGVEGVARQMAAAVGAGGGAGSSSDNATWVAAVARDLQAHQGTSLVLAGDYQPAAVHALAYAMNQALHNVGSTVTYGPAIEAAPQDQTASLRDLTTAMGEGSVELLVILGGNPAFSAPVDLAFAERLGKVPLAIYHGLYVDETATLCHWNVAETHALESWGDARAYDGTVTMMQPLIAPLYEGRSAHELLAAIAGQAPRNQLDLVKDYWTRAFAGQGGWTLRDSEGQPFADAEAFWKRAVHDGFMRGTALSDGGPATPFVPTPKTGAGGTAVPAAAVAAPPPSAAAVGTQPDQATSPAANPGAALPAGGLELIFRPDPTVWDGRFSNNGWLQELPKPLTKVTWDTSAWIHPALADQHGLQDGDVIELRYRGNTARMPVFRVGGHPRQSVTVFFGYGRRMAGRVGNSEGLARQFNPFLLRTSDAPWFGNGLEIAKTGERHLLATTQEHHMMEGRAPVRVANLEEYLREPGIIAEMGEKPPDTLSMIPFREFDTPHKWGMSIDLTSCTGCGTCTMACNAENNIPVVGKDQVSRGREMHWIRVDHYYTGNPDQEDTVQAVHQPVPCMQCETAPCELVCPVAATTHSTEGLNDMTYNRCVGTRYCSNNCPYKVRRFNFLLYQDWDTKSLWPLRNPDVTVRSRGVMEKCTYCVQRINQGRIDAKREDRKVRDGEVVPACAAACPADAIVFGDLNDPESRVSKLKKQERNYGLLEDLNTRPRTTYLAELRNPNPELAAVLPAGRGTEH